MRLLITGASGLIGKRLMLFWREKGHTVYTVSRTPALNDRFALGYQDLLPELDVVVNLAGELIVGYWTESKKRRIMESRLQTTRWVVKEIRGMKRKPKKFISASAIGIYGDQGDEVIDEKSILDPEKKFRYQVCQAWEAAADEAIGLGVSVTKVRIGNLFVWKERFLGYLYPFWKCGIFPRLATPETWIPWISLEDMVRMIDWIVLQERSPEVMNGVAPNPFQWRDFENVVRQYFPIKVTVPVDRLGMRCWMGEMAQALQDSQRIVSQVVEERGFQFCDRSVEEYMKRQSYTE